MNGTAARASRMGLRLTAEEVADGIKEREAGEVIGRLFWTLLHSRKTAALR